MAHSFNYEALALLARIKQAAQAVALPARLSDAVANVDRLKAEADAVDTGAARAAAIAEARDGKLADRTVTKLATLTTKKDVLGAAYEAELTALSGVVSRVADEFLANVRSAVYDPALAKLQEVADTIEDGATVAALVRDGRHADASLLVEADAAAKELKRAHDLRALAFGPAGGPVKALTRYSTPDLVVPHVAADSAEAVVANLRNGAEPWLPTPAEVTQLKQDRIAAEASARAAHVKRIR